MEPVLLIKEKRQQVGGYRVIQTGKKVETINNLNQVFHYIDLSYVQANIIYHGWVGFRSNDQIKEILDGHFIEMFRVYKCRNMLIDATKMSGSFSEVNEWLTNTYMPKLSGLGLRNLSVVLPQDIFAQLAMKDWLKRTKNIQTSAYYLQSDSLNWLAMQ